MAAPTFVTSASSGSWTTTTSPKTATGINTQSGDLVLSALLDENDAGNENYTWTSSPSETWTELAETTTVTASDVLAQAAHTTTTSAWSSGSVTCTRTAGTVERYGQVATVWRSHNGIGNVATSAVLTGTTPSASFTTAYNNSAILVVFGDWNARAAATRTYSSVNSAQPVELSHQEVLGGYTGTIFYYADAGTAGAKTISISGWNAAVDARMYFVEIRGAASATTYAAAGTIALTSGATGAITNRRQVAGTVAATTALAGAVTARRPSSGTIAISTAATGAVTSIRPVSGTVPGTSGLTGSITARRPVSGTTPIVTGVSGNASVLGGPVVYSASGTIALSSGASGTVTRRRQAAGTVPIITTITGDATRIGAPQVHQASGTVELISTVTGTLYEPALTTYLFSPPTHEEPIRTLDRGVARYRLTYANSVVLVGGSFRSVRSPSPDLLAGLTEGVGFFRGGHEYVVTANVAELLIASGFSPIAMSGYGVGPYGIGGFGY